MNQGRGHSVRRGVKLELVVVVVVVILLVEVEVLVLLLQGIVGGRQVVMRQEV
jgi:hypothetical protein